MAVCIRIAQVDEIGELEDRGLRLFPHASAVANGEQDDRHRYSEQNEGPRLGLCRDRGERAENEKGRFVWQEASVQAPPSAEGISPDLKRDDDIDERAVHEVLRDRRQPDRPRLTHHLAARMRANPVIGRVLEKIAGVFLLGFGIKLAVSR